jgi:hypothetical protein
VGKGSRDAISALGLPFDPTTLAAPTDGYVLSYSTATGRLALAALSGVVTNLTMAAAGVLSWTGRTKITAPGDGSLLVEKQDGTDLLQLATSGALSWPNGLGAIFQLSGPADQTFSIRAGASTQLALCSDESVSIYTIAGLAQHIKTSGLLASSTYTGGQDPPDNGIGALGVIGFLASATTAVDTGFSRTAAGAVALGNGVAGNASGSLALGTIQQGGAITKRASSKSGIADSTATTFAKVALANGAAVGGSVKWTVVNSTGDKVRRGSFTFAAVRSSVGALTSDVDASATTSFAESAAGTLTVTPTITDGSTEINLQVNANQGAAVTHTIYYEVEVSPTATVTPA